MYPFKFQDEVNTNLIREKLHFATFEPFSPTLSQEINRGRAGDNIVTLLYDAIYHGHQRVYYEGRIVPSMELIMSDQDLDLGDLISLLGFGLPGPGSIAYNLLWYLLTDVPYLMNPDERYYLSNLSSEQLLELLYPHYKGSTDRASLLFASWTGRSTMIPDHIFENPIYEEILDYDSEEIWNLAIKAGIINFEKDYISPYPPHFFVALNYSTVDLIKHKIVRDNYKAFFPHQRFLIYNTNGEPSVDTFANLIGKYTVLAIDGAQFDFTEYLVWNEGFMIDVLKHFGFHNLPMNVNYNLIWYLCYAIGPFENGLTHEEITNLSEMDPATLLDLLGPNYDGPKDQASLLFASVSGASTHQPDLFDLPRYPEIIQTYYPFNTWYLATTFYNPQLIYPPYVYIAMHPGSQLEVIAGTLNFDNVDSIMNHYGIVLAPIRPQDPISKIAYTIKELAFYHTILARDPHILPPPPLSTLTDQQITDVFRLYTLKELTDAYNVQGPWSDRSSLLNLVLTEHKARSQQRLRYEYCNNDDPLVTLLRSSFMFCEDQI